MINVSLINILISYAKNALRQINVLYRFSGIFDITAREIIHNTLILAKFNYCPLVWHFCDKSSTRKIEKTQERALRCFTK